MRRHCLRIGDSLRGPVHLSYRYSGSVKEIYHRKKSGILAYKSGIGEKSDRNREVKSDWHRL